MVGVVQAWILFITSVDEAFDQSLAHGHDCMYYDFGGYVVL
jgi:hypothetical protein